MTGPRTWGIDATYTDAFGQRHEVPPRVQAAVLEAMRVGEKTPGGEQVAVARPGSRLSVAGELTLEDGSELGTIDRLPRDLPFGYHRLRRGEFDTLLIVGPGRCHLPGPLRAWGWAAQLYATRSMVSWGIGDLADLARLAAWSHDVGADYVVVNPLLAPGPALPQEASPYFPSTRRFRSPLYLRVEEVPGASAVDLGALAGEARGRNAERIIDRDRVYSLKLAALQAIWEARPPLAGLDAYRVQQGAALREWALFSALAERHGAAWRLWPEPYRRTDSPVVARFAAEQGDRVAFHEWLQWLIDVQLQRASASGAALVHDVPIGFDPNGADAWAWQELLADGASMGVPPDRFNGAGQDWGLPPFIPERLRRAWYRPFIETLRASLRYAGGLRLDHVLGLFRQWWVPQGNEPTAGAYVRYPADELLEIVALESARAGALVIGEDLGTVEPGVRRELRRRRLLSSRLVYFERRPAASYPRLALAAVGTHDLPTVAGAWLGTDLEDQVRAGLVPDAAGLAAVHDRLARAAHALPDTAPREVIERVHASLAASPSLLVIATLEDALAVEERVNNPRTVRERPNWSIALPRPLEDLTADPFVLRLARAMRRGR
ncbi:MAG: 4-alpha-glucanotransferase [Chloroflexota bacterium]|nr:4-alpha-glucanotransferase [Chloroflexota bacterium]